MAIAESFGGRLRMLREAAGLSARSLDAKAGCGIGYAAMIESGARGKKVGLDVARRYARALGCTLDWLLDGSGKGPRLKGRAA